MRGRGNAARPLGIVLLCAGSFAGTALPGEEDAALETRTLIDDTWKEIRRLSQEGDVDESVRLQRETAAELIGYYYDHASTETGKKALASAFMMWANVGDADAVDAAMPRIDPGSDAWGGLVNSINNAYSGSGRSAREYHRLMIHLDRRVTDPKGRSEVQMLLSEYYLHRGRRKRARKRLEEVIRLDADPFYVKGAKGDIYEMESLGLGRLAPDFTSRDTEGRQVRLADLRGKVVVVEFWSTTCGPCLPEIPHLREIFQQFGPEGVEVVGISLDRELSVLEPFIVREKIDWPQICDEKAFDGKIARAYNVSRIPRSYVIDAQGRIVAKDARGAELVAAVREQIARSAE